MTVAREFRGNRRVLVGPVGEEPGVAETPGGGFHVFGVNYRFLIHLTRHAPGGGEVDENRLSGVAGGLHGFRRPRLPRGAFKAHGSRCELADADIEHEGRGGGSREDLWVFNAEVIARAAFACKTPLISAIGHEIDYTILDFVADQRAPTPSAAAELAVPDREEQWNILQNLQQNISENMQKRLKLCYNELEQYNLALERKPAHHIWKRDFDQLEQAGQTLQIQIQRRMQAANMQLEHAAALTASLSPYRVLARGYAMITTGRGQILPADQLEPDKTVYIRSASRRAKCRVEAVEEIDESTQKL